MGGMWGTFLFDLVKGHCLSRGPGTKILRVLKYLLSVCGHVLGAGVASSQDTAWCTGMTQRDGMGREVGGGSGWGTRVHPWQIHVDVWQN